MSKHILLAKATRSPFREVPELPSAAKFDYGRGYWRLQEKPLVLTEARAATK